MANARETVWVATEDGVPRQVFAAEPLPTPKKKAAAKKATAKKTAAKKPA